MTFFNSSMLFERGTLAGKIAGAIVVNNNDPNKTQRILIRIPTLHTNRSDSDLPWAVPINHGTQGNSNAIGDINIPIIGSKVAIFFPEDDEHNPYYIGDWNDAGTKIAELLENYPNSYGRIDATGNLFLVNTQTNTARWIHVTGSYIKFNADGSGEVGFAGNLDVKSNTAVNIDAPEINLNCGDASGLTITPRTRPTATSFSNQIDF